jgi:protein-S-isoprenylcysteine O-methyltransferase Ste14
MKKLILQSLQTFLIGSIVLGLILFLPAWSLGYWQAWVFIMVFAVSANFIGLYLSVTDPALLERRKQVGPAAEQSIAQKIIMSLAFVAIFSLLVFCSLDNRFGWSPRIPALLSIFGDLLVAAGLLLNLLVFKENSFGGASIKTEIDQKVISTGPYAVIRHPMYAFTIIMMAGVPLALGSLWGLAVLLIQVPVLIWRILDEETTLKKELPGYIDYMRKVRFRLFPYVW